MSFETRLRGMDGELLHAAKLANPVRRVNRHALGPDVGEHGKVVSKVPPGRAVPPDAGQRPGAGQQRRRSAHACRAVRKVVNPPE